MAFLRVNPLGLRVNPILRFFRRAPLSLFTPDHLFLFTATSSMDFGLTFLPIHTRPSVLVHSYQQDSFRVNLSLYSHQTSVLVHSYQQEGVDWLAFLHRFGLHGVLSDDMGLGKTLQVRPSVRVNPRFNLSLPLQP